MLVLNRHTDESIIIGDDAEITVLEIKGNTVKLGVSAHAIYQYTALRCT